MREAFSPSLYWRGNLLGCLFTHHFMRSPTIDTASTHPRGALRADVRRILGYVYFTFVCYLAIGLPLAILPAYVHLRMGYHASLAGLVISIQYIATFLSRPWAGRIRNVAIY